MLGCSAQGCCPVPYCMTWGPLQLPADFVMQTFLLRFSVLVKGTTTEASPGVLTLPESAQVSIIASQITSTIFLVLTTVHFTLTSPCSAWPQKYLSRLCTSFSLKTP